MSTNGEPLSEAYLDQIRKRWQSYPWWRKILYRARTWWALRIVLKVKL